MKTLPTCLWIILILVLYPFLLPADTWQKIAPSPWRYDISRFNGFDFDDGHYELYVWADTLVHFDSRTEGWDTLEASQFSEFEVNGDKLIPHFLYLESIGRSRTDRSRFSIFEGEYEGDGMAMTLLYGIQTGKEDKKFTTGSCWPTGSFMVHAGAAISPMEESIIFCAYDMHGKLYRSTHEGAFTAWADAPYAETDRYDPGCGYGRHTNILEASPFDTNLVFVSGYPDVGNSTDRLYKTTDNGQHWSEVFSIVTPNNSWFVLQQLLFHPADSTILFLRTDSALYRSTTAGNTWAQMLGNQPFTALGIAHNRPDILFAGSTGGRLYRSTDAGLHWELFNNTFSRNPVIGLFVFPEGDTVIAATAEGLFKIYGKHVSDLNLDVSDAPAKEKDEQWMVWPNPSSAQTMVYSSTGNTWAHISFIDLFGRPVRQYEHVSGTVVWDGKDKRGHQCSPGVYLCVISTGTTTSVVRVIRE